MPAWKRWAAAAVSEFLALALLVSVFLGWRIALLAVIAVAAVLISGDIFLLKLKPSVKEHLGAYTFPLFQAFLLSTVVAVLLVAAIYSAVVVG